MNNLVVSVLMITYNHEQFIASSIDGVLMQKTNFRFRLIIGEDFSTDKTRQICEEYASQNSDKILLLPSDKNWGMTANFIRTYESCEAQYIALCEGDDFWTDPNKLQKQVDFLANNSGFVICGHCCNIVDSNGNMIGMSPANGNRIFSQKDIAKKNPLNTMSVVFRNVITVFPEWFTFCPIGDWALYLLLTEHGDAYQFPDNMASYRKHESGVWSGASHTNRYQKTILQLDLLSSAFPEYKRIFSLTKRQSSISYLYWKEINLYNLIKCFLLKLITPDAEITFKDLFYRLRTRNQNN